LSQFADAQQKLAAIRHRDLEWNATMANQALADMEAMTGLGPIFPRIQIPRSAGTMTFNNIKVDNSNIGALNTGNVRQIDASVTALNQAGGGLASEALRKLTQAVLDEPNIDTATKNGLVEQIAFLGAQAATPKAERKPGMIKMTIAAIGTTANTIKSVAGAWNAVAPVLKGWFGE